jgi:hypothetical protein
LVQLAIEGGKSTENRIVQKSTDLICKGGGLGVSGDWEPGQVGVAAWGLAVH